MEKIEVYLRKEELVALRAAAARSRCSLSALIRDAVRALIRDAVRKVVLKPQGDGPVAIWDGVPRRTSVDHDNLCDER